MQFLKERKLDQLIKNIQQPFLGICLGLQLMCKSSEEGNTICLGIFEAQVKKFPKREKVPHMGWNEFESQKDGFLDGILGDVYYVHSYYAELCSHTTATCDYITKFSACLQKDNFYATQFHLEKSGKVGEKILNKFLNL